MPSEPFRFLLRVRYNECDAQGIVFNARWVDYVDVAATEYTRALFSPLARGRADARRAPCGRAAASHRPSSGSTHSGNAPSALPSGFGTDQHRAALERGAPGIVVDHAGALR